MLSKLFLALEMVNTPLGVSLMAVWKDPHSREKKQGVNRAGFTVQYYGPDQLLEVLSMFVNSGGQHNESRGCSWLFFFCSLCESCVCIYM